MFFESTNEYLFEPFYIFPLLILMGLVFFAILIYCFIKFKFNKIGFVFLIISCITYLLVGIYMLGKGYYLDGNEGDITVFRSYGLVELTLLVYPYIFLTLACSIGKKKV
ncbi:hypothetical protein WKH57_01800 [Niallia taxi]|uniref:hypothetical protein n=1 Tax=Niallia taxi TaxID=2499688 RepID=UPI00316BCB39